MQMVKNDTWNNIPRKKLCIVLKMQFLIKNFQKPLDISNRLWYNIKAVAKTEHISERLKKLLKNRKKFQKRY